MEFNQGIGTEQLVVFGVVFATILFGLFVLRGFYLSWLKRKYGFRDSYLKKREKFDESSQNT